VACCLYQFPNFLSVFQLLFKYKIKEIYCHKYKLPYVSGDIRTHLLLLIMPNSKHMRGRRTTFKTVSFIHSMKRIKWYLLMHQEKNMDIETALENGFL
jgi:hypothetical protein